LCKVVIKKAIREFLPNTERGRDIPDRSQQGQNSPGGVPRLHRVDVPPTVAYGRTPQKNSEFRIQD